MSKPITIAKRKAWRDLRGNASPAGWMSDEQLEAVTPKMVTLKAIKAAVKLANAAPAAIEALKKCEDVIGMARLQGKLSNSGLSPVNDALIAARNVLDSVRA